MLNLSRLNPEQREAVTAGEGPVLVIAGPGSGKTAVIASRVAYLIDSGKASPSEVLAITYTNKAGRELRKRLASVLGEVAEDIWAGTFHAFALSLLRQWGWHFGFEPDKLSIYSDDEDRRDALDQALTDLGYEPKTQPRDLLLDVIGKTKSRLVWPEDVAEANPEMSQVYAAYQDVLKRRNAIDFDDFLLYGTRLLKENQDVAEELRFTYRHVLVDEYQDVAYAQHRFVRLLTEASGNIFVVGDHLQNLFSWRGSDIRYLLDFQRDFPGVQIIALKQNYRSTQAILDTANCLSAVLRYGDRNLWTTRPPGIPIILRPASDAQSEAGFVTAEVRRLLTEKVIASPSECAVLYRTNAQAREFELACIQAGVGYSVRGNHDFLTRKEIRDLMAYLRLIHNPMDTAALARAVNTPPRRLASIEKRIRDGDELNLERLVAEYPCDLKQERSRTALNDFIDLMTELVALAAEATPAEVVEAALQRSGYREWLRQQDDGDKRLGNIAALQDMVERSGADTLADLLDELGLATDVDTGTDSGGVSLSTIHAAKGLEWPVVFVAGLEDGLLPHVRSLEAAEGEDGTLDEELRLLYVAVTRAIERLYLTYAQRRYHQGRRLNGEPSRFLKHLPVELVAGRAV